MEFDKIQDDSYRNLVRNQYRIISANVNKIKQKAESIYDLVVNKKNAFYAKLSNDFAKLEKDCDCYQQLQSNKNTDKNEKADV